MVTIFATRILHLQGGEKHNNMFNKKINNFRPPEFNNLNKAFLRRHAWAQLSNFPYLYMNKTLIVEYQ